jgi:hypothetical protein
LRGPGPASPSPAAGTAAGAAFALGLRLGIGLLRLRGCLVREDRALVLARQQALELIPVDRLALDQDVRDLVQLVHVRAKHGERELVRLLDHAADLVVDLARDLLRVVGLGAIVAAEEGLVEVSRPARAGPSFSLIPKRMIICFAIDVIFSRSLAAPS